MVPFTDVLFFISIFAVLLQQVSAEDTVCETAGGEVVEPQKDCYEKASHYDVLWGNDNMHLGYYPHLVPQYNIRVKLTPPQATLANTERMMTLANIGASGRVFDLGSGKGLTCLQIASSTNASCTGVDLTSSNVARAKNLAAANPQLQLDFYQGSFTNLTDAIVDSGPYNVVFSQDAFCHVHDFYSSLASAETSRMFDCQ